MGYNIKVPFALRVNFIDPVYDKDGSLYAPKRYNELIREKYYISQKTRISYSEINEMTPSERRMVAQMILEDMRREREALDKKMNHHQLM